MLGTIQVTGLILSLICDYWREELPESGTRALPADLIDFGEFSHNFLNPWELQKGCLRQTNHSEEKFRKRLERGDDNCKLDAAKILWKGHSRRYAADVLKFIAGPPPGGEPFRAFQREVEASLQPAKILDELKKGDYLWATWLAFLRPHKDFVPVLLTAIKDKPEQIAETLLALGNSGDPRAMEPLLELLKSKDYWIPGHAAQALGYLGNSKAEPHLIVALDADNNYRQVHACEALEKIGTTKSLEALEKLVKENKPTGVLNVIGMAEIAIESIQRRENKLAD